MLAADLARRAGGRVERVFHTDSEPSLVPGMGRFLHLTQGFRVCDRAGAPLATLVDDVTITADLDPRAAAPPGWFRVLTDDARLLRLIARHADPSAAAAEVLDPVAAVFGARAQAIGPVVRLDDPAGATVALAAPLGGERERPCEVVTPPLVAGHRQALGALLAPAAELGFTVPLEGAVHLHVDAAPFREVAAFRNVVRLFGHWRRALWCALGTNPACRRLGALPPALVDLVEQPWDGGDGWPALRGAASATGPTKFLDVNLTGVLAQRPRHPTLEVRVLPGSLDAAATAARAALVEALLVRCRDDRPVPRPSGDDPRRSVDELRGLAEGDR